MIIPAQDITLHQSTPMKEALEALERSRIKIILLVDNDGKLTGTCTDGDFRRAIIKLGKTKGSVTAAANRNPFSVNVNVNSGTLQTLFKDRNIRHIPVVDDEGVLLGLYADNHRPRYEELKIPVILMAGGLGRRLMPLTEDCPKPLLPLGDKPILEHILLKFANQGFKRFYISINYLGHMIEEYFGTGESLGIEISYLRETKRLGTGGALDLLPANMSHPFIVMNGDLLTETDFNSLVDAHISSGAVATMGVREYMTSIPFGVVEFDKNVYKETVEKPTLKHHINTGIYCLSKRALDLVPTDEFYDMPSLFEDLTQNQRHCSVHVIRDRWLDVGTPQEYRAAQRRFNS